MRQKLFRSRSNAMIAGVCGGLGAYFGLEPTLVRIFFILLAITNSMGFLLYFLLWIILPREDYPDDVTLGDIARSGVDEIATQARAMGDDLRQAAWQPHPQVGLVIGVVLVIVGAYYLLENLSLPWLRWLDSSVIWPVLLIFAGLILLFRHRRGA